MSSLLKVGMVGLGTISYIHQIAIEQSGLGELVAVCDINPKTQKDYEAFRFYTHLEEMLSVEDLDVVHICLPHDLHKSATELILSYGVHVFMEKPIGISYQEAKELSEFEKEYEKKVGICFQNRYNRSIVTLKERLQSETVEGVKGLVVWFRPESYYKLQPWRGQMERAGGGVIINQAIHTLDLMHFVAGEAIECSAQLSQLLDYDIEVEDTASALFEFDSGAKGVFMATNGYVENSTVELEVKTNRNKYVIKDNCLYQYNNEGQREFICEDDLLEGYKSYYGQGHKICVKQFYQAIVDDTEEYIRIDDAINTMQMVDMMKLSSENGRTIKVKELI
ncbi:Gfo/Idh/MocA family protein [Aerococcaceae bacterium WGS1372]